MISAKARCRVRTTRELVEELRRAEFDEDFVSPVIAAASKPATYHLFWDDIDKWTRIICLAAKVGNKQEMGLTLLDYVHFLTKFTYNEHKK